jgi:pyridoxamine 5'-phosphate oxidase
MAGKTATDVTGQAPPNPENVQTESGRIKRNHEPPPSHYDDLQGSLAHAWALLVRGVGDRHSPFHTPTIANVGADTKNIESIAIRTVVLRAASPVDWTLRFHTDRRSDKAPSLQASPRVAAHFYDAPRKVQLRLQGRAVLHLDDAIADAAWQKSSTNSRACYGQPVGSGHAIDAPLDAWQSGALDAAAARANFAAVIITVDRMEWLYLAAHGHRRALFQRNVDTTITSQWLAP